VQELLVPAKEVLIRASVADLDGGPQFLTSTRFDLTQAGSVDLLVAPDYNGKSDIRGVAVGFVTPAPVEPVPASALAPLSVSAPPETGGGNPQKQPFLRRNCPCRS
jgi:hypothetical protein